MTGDAPSIAAVRNRLIEELVRFVRQLRAAGVSVPADGGLAAARALGTVGLGDERRARIAVHAALVGHDTDRDTFDRLFDDFWYRLQAILEAAVKPDAGDGPEDVFAPLGGEAGGHAPPRTQPPASPRRSVSANDGTGGRPESGTGSVTDRRVVGDAESDTGEEGGTAARYSPGGASEPVTLEHDLVFGDDELGARVDALGDALGGLRARAWTHRGDRRPDVRRALRSSVSSGGVTLPVPEQDTAHTATRATVLVDVSQSVLDTIDRGFLVRFLREVTTRWRRVRVFFFDTDVRDVTAAFEAPTVDAAVSALDAAEAEWGGGTRIGHAFEVIETTYPEAVDRRTAVFVISDGLEVGDVDRVAEGAAWLGARAALVLWLNPLAADTDYEPTVRGMAAALPHVDGLFAFTDPGDVAELVEQLRVRGHTGNIGYEYVREPGTD